MSFGACLQSVVRGCKGQVPEVDMGKRPSTSRMASTASGH